MDKELGDLVDMKDLLYINSLIQQTEESMTLKEKASELIDIVSEDSYVNFAIAGELKSILCRYSSKTDLEVSLKWLIDKLTTEHSFWMKNRVLTCLNKTFSNRTYRKIEHKNTILYYLTKHWSRIISSSIDSHIYMNQENLTEKDVFLFETVRLWRKIVKQICATKEDDRYDLLREITVNFSTILDIMVKSKYPLFSRNVLQLVNTALPYSDLSPLLKIHQSFIDCANLILTFLQKHGFYALPIGEESGFIGPNKSTWFLDGTQLRLVVILTLKSVAIVSKNLQETQRTNLKETPSTVDQCIKCLCDLDQFMKSINFKRPVLGCLSFEDNWIPALFCDQDDMWIESLLTLLDIYKNLDDKSDFKRLAELNAILNPHRQFIYFLKAMEFDESLLIDLITSPETCFLLYFSRYLKCVHTQWYVFRSITNRIETRMLSTKTIDLKRVRGENDCHKQGCSSNLKKKSKYSRNCKLKQQTEPKLGNQYKNEERDLDLSNNTNSGSEVVMSSVVSSGLMLVGLYDSDSNSEDAEIDYGGSREITETSNTSITHYESYEPDDIEQLDITLNHAETIDMSGHYEITSFTTLNQNKKNHYVIDHMEIGETSEKSQFIRVSRCDNLLDSMMACIIRLRIKVEKLRLSGLFPYNPEPLIANIQRVEELYENS